MNITEADALVALAREGAAAQDLDDARVASLATYLVPLPFEQTKAAIERWCALARTDGRPKFLSSADDILDAAGIPASARNDLARAKADGGELLPSLRAVSGWEYVAPDGPLPQGVAEALTVAGKPLPPGRAVAALAAPVEEPHGPPAEVIDRMRSLAERRSVPAVRTATESGHPTLPPREKVPSELLAAYDALERALRSAENAKQSHAANADEYRARLEEMAREHVGVPIEAAKDAAVRLIRRLVLEHGEVTAAEVIAEVWGLKVKGFETAPKDRFEGEPPTRVRVLLEEVA